MRVAILADIHSNLPALEAVLYDAACKGIKTFWCLGDVVGYGPWPVQCWTRLLRLGIAKNAWVVGNQELGLLNKQSRELYADNEDARTVLGYHYRDCQRGYQSIFEQIKRIETIAQPMPGVILAHGVPKPNDTLWTVTTYVKKFYAEQAMGALSEVGIHPQIIAVGHTHKPVFWQRVDNQNRKGVEWIDEDPKGEVSLGDLSRETVCLNPGSVGQPRPKDQGREASYCYIDWDKMAICFRRVPYLVESTRKKMEELDYPQKLIECYYSGSCKMAEMQNEI